MTSRDKRLAKARAEQNLKDTTFTNDELWSISDLEILVLDYCRNHEKTLEVLYNTYTPEVVCSRILNNGYVDILERYNLAGDEDSFIEWLDAEIDEIWRI